MKTRTAHASAASEPPDQASALTERRPVPVRGTTTDEEAFYAAQEDAFADLRARNQARPRRKP
jgi:hypothetical protein